MTLFEFIMGMVSVTLALAVAQLLIGVAHLVQSEAKVRFYWPHAIWIINLFLIAFVHWWSLWTFRDLDWNFALFFYSLLGPSMLFFAASMISPREHAVDVIDLSQHFLRIRKMFLSAFLATLILITLDGPLFGTEPPFNMLRAAQAAIAALSIWGLITPNHRVQFTNALAVLIVVLVVVVIRFFPGQVS